MPEVLHAICFWWILMALVLLWQEAFTVTWTFWMWYRTSSLPLYPACHSPASAPTLTQVPFSVLLRLLWALLLSLFTTLSLFLLLSCLLQLPLPLVWSQANQNSSANHHPIGWKIKRGKGLLVCFESLVHLKHPEGVSVCFSECEKESWEETVQKTNGSLKFHSSLSKKRNKWMN